MSAFTSSDTDIRWDDPSDLDTGSEVAGGATTTAVVTVILDGVPTIATAATAQIIVTTAPIAAGSWVSIDGVVLTATAGAPATPDEFDGSSVDPAVVAANLAATINTGSVGTWGIAGATATGTSIALVADQTGIVGNEIAVVSNVGSIVASGPLFTGGAELATLTIAGQVLTGVDGARTPGGMDFNINDAGASLADAINDPENTPLAFVTARWTGTGLYISSAVAGLQGNGISIESTSAALSLTATQTSGGTGTPCPPGKDNSLWNILGVNIYRSDTGDRGPYFRVNSVPIGALFYRDKTDMVEVPAEVIPWEGGWVFRGDSPNSKGWRLHTRYRPIVKREGNAVPADSPFDVEVYIDGQRVMATAVFGPTAEIDISTEQIWDAATESYIDPVIPTATSVVAVRYSYQRLSKLENTIDRRFKVFYRITSVALDPTGTSPTGLVETPLGFCAPISPMNSENMDYIWREGVRRNQWILDQGGERVKLFIRRVTGAVCPCHWDPRLQEYSKQPLNHCLQCYGTGFTGGYEGPYPLIIGPEDSERRVSQSPTGRRLENTYEVWIGYSPMVTQRDFIVKQNGERYSIGPVRRPQVRGLVLQQHFNIGYLDSGDIRYRVPMGFLDRLPWPQTRFNRPQDAPCEDSDPFPIGNDPSGAPMGTEKDSIPDGREQRGRTPVWQHLTYGGKGGR